MSADRQVVLFFGAVVAIAIIARLILGPVPVVGPGDIYATAHAPPAALLAVGWGGGALAAD